MVDIRPTNGHDFGYIRVTGVGSLIQGFLVQTQPMLFTVRLFEVLLTDGPMRPTIVQSQDAVALWTLVHSVRPERSGVLYPYLGGREWQVEFYLK